MKRICLGLLLLLSEHVYALEVEQAYQLIPHNRTVFQLHQSNLPATDAQKVASLLSLAEKAMVERVDALKNGARRTGYMSRIDDILWQIEQLQVPEQIQAARDHINTAVQLHRNYFELQDAGGSSADASRQQLIQASHRHLLAAYQQLMEAYPEETQHNKQAFFDYLCALDFI